jgi:hypothetical protein
MDTTNEQNKDPRGQAVECEFEQSIQGMRLMIEHDGHQFAEDIHVNEMNLVGAYAFFVHALTHKDESEAYSRLYLPALELLGAAAGVFVMQKLAGLSPADMEMAHGAYHHAMKCSIIEANAGMPPVDLSDVPEGMRSDIMDIIADVTGAMRKSGMDFSHVEVVRIPRKDGDGKDGETDGE